MIGSDGSQSAAQIGGVIIDCFFLFASADRRGCGVGGGGVIEGRKSLTGGGVPTTHEKYKTNCDSLEEREGNFNIYKNKQEMTD